MDNCKALDPKQSVVVEACAGSGKTWLLVSRIVRLLLGGVAPSEILAITFTRRAAQEMQARLRDWLYELASRDDDYVREFLREREVADADIEHMLPRARRLYQQFLLAQPSITISTFHGWFMQILQRAPLNTAGGVQLVEQTAELWQEAWQTFLDELHRDQEGETARSMTYLFTELGLSNTQKLLHNFVGKRSEWWAYTQGQTDALSWAALQLQNELGVEDIEFDPVADWGMCGNSEEVLFAFSIQLAINGTGAQQAKASELEQAWTDTQPEARFDKVRPLLFTQKGEPRIGSPFKPNTKQNTDAFMHTREVLQSSLQATRDEYDDIAALHMNRHALRCGVALLEHYQALKQRQQLLDFGDLEWRVCQLLNDSDHAEYLQYKLDSRYRHVLLDEFQDTNPLQWQILQSWFAASCAVNSPPAVFVVGDPKQSIYRFRRADARLFDVVREFLVTNYAAVHLKKNETRRNAPAVLDVVNGVFDGLKEYEGFEKHTAHQKSLAGCVEVMPLSRVNPQGRAATATLTEDRKENHAVELKLRNPLTEAYQDSEEGAREIEATQFAEKISQIVGKWQVTNEGQERQAEFSDIMVLVRRRTHLKVYEQALRRLCIPYLTSRRGGLLDTLEASDIQALLNFLITPFADLALAHALRTPIFSCSDDDLMSIAGLRIEKTGSGIEDRAATVSQSSFLTPRSSWWQRVKQLVENGEGSSALQRAYRLLQGWMLLADKLPVHDLLDRVYFEGEVKHRYAAAVPEVMRATVLANLQAFLEIALEVDAGRYPSLPGFLRELAELRKASDNESPDEGRVAQAGDAIRIYTVHEAKGLEAPIVWLLDTNAKPPADRGYEVLIDWPTDARAPAHFSVYGDKASRGAVREHYFEQEETLAAREDLNLLYVAMTRAKQFLIVSGNGALIADTWYDRIVATEPQPSALNPQSSIPSVAVLAQATGTARPAPCGYIPKISVVDERLCHPLPTGTRKPSLTDQQRYGIWLHGLLQHLAPSSSIPDQTTSHLTKPASGQVAGYPPQAGEEGAVARERDDLQRRLHIAPDQMPLLWQQAQKILNTPDLIRFFDAQYYLAASNEIAYVNAGGELKRIDRLVEFESEVWVLDYKTGAESQTHSTQLEEYRAAMQAIHPNKVVRCALIFADGKFVEA